MFAPTRLLAVSLVLLACSSPGATGTQASATGTETGAASEPTTTAPTGATTASSGAGSESDTVGGSGVTEDASGSTGATTMTGATTGGGTSSSSGDASSGGTSSGDASSGDASTGGTTGGDEQPFFPPCDELAIGEPITFDDLTEPGGWRTPAGLAWDGHDLVVVRDDRDAQTNACETVFERRDANGQLLAPAVRTPAVGICQFNGALGYEPVSDTFLYASQGQGGLRLTALDAGGAKLWDANPWVVCNSLMQSVDIASRDGEWVVLGEAYSCGIEGDRSASAAVYTTAGGLKQLLKTDKEISQSADAACDLPACQRLLTLRYGNEGQDTGVWLQMGDLATGELDPAKTKLNGISFAGWDATASAYNGTDWLLLRIEDQGANHKGFIRRRDEQLGWTSDEVSFPSGGTPMEIELLWTGHDYVAVFSEFPDTNMGHPDDFFDVTIHVVLIGADGQLKQHEKFERDDKGFGGHAPQLVALPGAIAMSWVRVTEGPNNTRTYSRHLSRIGCAN